MTKTYTTEEITRRLKAGERIIRLADGIYFSARISKDDTIISVNYDTNAEYWVGMSEFNKYFMFTSDYEAMKSEEKGYNETLHPLTEIKQDIPEWLQRERVRFWGNAYLVYVQLNASSVDNCFENANEDLKQFDKRFLTQKETK